MDPNIKKILVISLGVLFIAAIIVSVYLIFSKSKSGCVPNCNTKNCGSDGCNGSCGTCTGTDYCDSTGQCKNCPTCNPPFLVSDGKCGCKFSSTQFNCFLTFSDIIVNGKNYYPSKNKKVNNTYSYLYTPKNNQTPCQLTPSPNTYIPYGTIGWELDHDILNDYSEGTDLYNINNPGDTTLCFFKLRTDNTLIFDIFDSGKQNKVGCAQLNTNVPHVSLTC